MKLSFVTTVVGRTALPVVPPTPVRVYRMLQGTHRDAAEVIGAMPPDLNPVYGRKGRDQCGDGWL